MKFDYYCVDEAYTPQDLTDLNIAIQKNIVNHYGDLPAQGVTKTSDVDVVTYGDLKPEIERLTNIVYDVNKNFFGFNLHNVNDFLTLLYNDYTSEKKGEYSWHIDAVRNEPYDIKLTALLDCSTEKYQGGEFSIFVNGEQKIESFNGSGQLVVFPSYIPHRVTPVTKGTRKSLAMFFTGPNLQ